MRTVFASSPQLSVRDGTCENSLSALDGNWCCHCAGVIQAAIELGFHGCSFSVIARRHILQQMPWSSGLFSPPFRWCSPSLEPCGLVGMLCSLCSAFGLASASRDGLCLLLQQAHLRMGESTFVYRFPDLLQLEAFTKSRPEPCAFPTPGPGDNIVLFVINFSACGIMLQQNKSIWDNCSSFFYNKYLKMQSLFRNWRWVVQAQLWSESWKQTTSLLMALEGPVWWQIIKAVKKIGNVFEKISMAGIRMLEEIWREEAILVSLREKDKAENWMSLFNAVSV